jgi:DNA-binding NarL/FixJ family response regulator
MIPSPPATISVLLAEDHGIVREGLCKLLESEKDMRVVGQAGNGREAVSLARQLSPNVVVMDVAMPLLNGLEATRQILRARPSSRVLILSAHSDEAYVERATEAGATGYLVKQTSARYLSEAIRTIHRGRPYHCPSLAPSPAPPAGRGKAIALTSKARHQLTSRELEVLQLIAEGLANKQAAAELSISVKTIEKHRQSLMEKLHIHDTAGLTRYAIATGIIECTVQLTLIDNGAGAVPG